MKYPSGVTKKKVTATLLGNRGLTLEDELNITNKYYLVKRIACIHKKPTPIQVVTVGKNSKITEAFFKTPSTTDYNGVYKSKYIDFEAKETNFF